MTEIFVFGSNLLGIHKRGAALCALKEHGALLGRGFGRQGMCYAIPTKETPYKTMPLIDINVYVAEFIIYAKNFKEELIFNVTPIGCGLAGYTPEDIAPMFYYAQGLVNVKLPIEFTQILQK